MKIKSLIKQGKEFLADRENALLECELVLAHVLGESKEYVFMNAEEEIDDFSVDLFMKYLQRLFEGEPLAYLLNEKEFFGLNLYVDNRVLVPRPETEQIVERVIEFAEADEDRKYKVLDVGTGSGNITVSLASNDLITDVLALDIDEGALEVAKINVEQYSLWHKVQLVQSDLLDVIEDGEYFDAIVANLPYIGEVNYRFVSTSAEKFEPNHALFGGESGVELYKKMFQQLNDKGIGFELMIGEFGFEQGRIMEDLLNKYFEHQWVIESDLAGIERIFIVKNHVR